MVLFSVVGGVSCGVLFINNYFLNVYSFPQSILSILFISEIKMLNRNVLPIAYIASTRAWTLNKKRQILSGSICCVYYNPVCNLQSIGEYYILKNLL